MQYTYPYRTC